MFPSLPDMDVDAAVSPRRVCIATWEIEGPSRNGGIGAAYASLADALKRAGHEVSILFLLGYHPTDGNMVDWTEYYRTKKDIRLIPLPIAHDPPIHAGWAPSVSYHTYSWLKEHQREFDIIHFPECHGLAYMSLLAKRQGLAFGDCLFVIGTHGPVAWVKDHSMEYVCDVGELEMDFMERSSVAMADVVLSPSQYLTRWMEQNGWKFPQRTYVVPNVLPQWVRSGVGEFNPARRRIREIVFFGRLGIGKGLKLFCNAIDDLCAGNGRLDFEIAFLGKETQIYGRSSVSYLCERAKKWPMPWRIVSNKYQREAVEYLRGEGRLAVISSLNENSPNAVLECTGGAVPMLASDVGGISELIALEDRENVCFEPRSEVLADRLREVLEKGALAARPSTSFLDVERRWAAWHSRVAIKEQKAGVKEPRSSNQSTLPLLSVCFAYDVRENGSESTLASLKKQDYPHLEILVAECGGSLSSLQGRLNGGPKSEDGRIRRIPLRSFEIGAGRNAAARQAKGEYLFFVDDHTLFPAPNSLSTYVLVATRISADILTSAMSFVLASSEGSSEDCVEHSRRLFVGGDVASGAFSNCFGSVNCLVRRDAFEKIGGFTDESQATLDDWELFSKAAIFGLRIETMPEVHLWYREDRNQDNLVHSMVNAVRSVRPYVAPGNDLAPAVQRALQKVTMLGQGLKLGRDVLIGAPLSRSDQGPVVTG